MTPDLLETCHQRMGVPVLEGCAELAFAEAARHSGLVTPESASVAEVVAAIVAGGRLPDDADQRFLEHQAENDRNVMLARRYSAAGEALRETVATTKATAVDKGLSVLADELDAVLNEARPIVECLGWIDTAAAAVEHDMADEWKALSKLADRLVEVRRVQRTLVADTRRDGSGPVLAVDLYGHVRNADQHGDVAGYRAQRQGPRRANAITGKPEEDVAVPWLGDPVRALLFQARADVETWVPNMAQLRAEERAVQERTKPAPDDADQGVQVTAGKDAPLMIRPANTWSRARAAGKQGG